MQIRRLTLADFVEIGVDRSLVAPGRIRFCLSVTRDDHAEESRKLERVMGIEPTLAAWEAAVLPLNYTRAG
jgi:hypothetical protein